MPFETKRPDGSTLREVKDHVSLWGVVRERLGEQSEREARAAFRNAWITEEDFQRIRAAGMNCKPKFRSATSAPNWRMPSKAIGATSLRSKHRLWRASASGGSRQRKPTM